MLRYRLILLLFVLVCFDPLGGCCRDSEWLDVTRLFVLSPFLELQTPEGEAARLLTEEMQKRFGAGLPVLPEYSPDMPEPVLVLTRLDTAPAGLGTEFESVIAGWKPRAEGYRLKVVRSQGRSVRIWAVGADDRGVLYAAGGLLRAMRIAPDRIEIPAGLDVVTAPAYPLRGHQLGYRAKANTYDAWTVPMFEQYIRDLVVFGANAVEGIPFEDPMDSPHFPIPRSQMNIALSEICFKYGIEYWLWMPVMEHRDEDAGKVGLSARDEQVNLLAQWRELFRGCLRLDGVFVPAADPGMNKAALLIPFLEAAAETLRESHPRAKVWLSHQGLGKEDRDILYRYLEETRPVWLSGLVYGPWTEETLSETRRRLPREYGIRSYPDITHTSRSQFPVLNWDRAFDQTVGREPINPRPAAMKAVHNLFAPLTIGFLTYSDGVHDDVNKMLWSALGWDPDRDVRGILSEYGRYFIDSGLGDDFADAVLALEKNWEGALAANGAVDGTLRLWQDLEQNAAAASETNWRFQALLFRAYYDSYVRHRLLYEQGLEEEANRILDDAGKRWDAHHTMFRAEEVLRKADTEPIHVEWKEMLQGLADRMFAQIGHQTGVERHGASDYDRGTMLDTMDHPLNNRWWLEDRFHAVREMKEEEQRLAELRKIPQYESPIPGTVYDDLGNVAAEPHWIRTDGPAMDPNLRWTLSDEIQSWEPYLDRRRLSQQDGVGNHPRWSPAWDLTMQYVGLNPQISYTLRAAVRKDGSSLFALHADGAELRPMGPAPSPDEIETYSVPPELTSDGVLTIHWTVEEGSGIHITETWLIPAGKD